MDKDSEIKVAFILPKDYWLGGRNYLRNLFTAVLALPKSEITPVIFTGTHPDNLSADFPQSTIVRASMLDYRSPSWIARKIIATGTLQDRMLRSLLESNEVSILSHSDHLGRQHSIATIGWIPDFQHVHLPEFFSADERKFRSSKYMDVCLHCTKIIVSSESARADLRSFAPEHASKAAVLRFVANPVSNVTNLSLDELHQLYGFSGPYILLPNQFWAHKNHRVVIRALQILKQRNQSVTVLATGSTTDYRQPGFFASLMDYVKRCEVEDLFRVFGTVPFDHLVSLMKYSMSFMNPSLFEGWSTSVEEAKSMGKQVILSDIPVHREQAPERGFYFPPNDPETLADVITAVANGFDENQDIAMQQLARDRFPARQSEFGETYRQIVRGSLTK